MDPMSLVRVVIYIPDLNVCAMSTGGQHFAKSPSSEEHVLASVSDLSPARQRGQASEEPLGGC